MRYLILATDYDGILAHDGQVSSADARGAPESVVEGDVATGIVSAVQATTCDLIVMGTHGRTDLGRLLMGNVAERVLRTAPGPVVTVKTPLPGAEAPSGASAAETGQPW